MNRPEPGSVEQRTAPETTPTVDGRRLRGVIPYNVESRDLGGWREVIDAGALNGAKLDDLICTREHDRGKLLGRHPSTLTTENRDDCFAWAVELPESPVGDDVRVAVERGDLRSTSWRMVVERDRWDGDVRHVEAIAELLDVTVTAAPAYGSALAELRSTPDPEHDPAGRDEENTMQTEDRHEQTAAGGLDVEDRTVTAPESRSRRGLADEFRSAGFPGEHAEVSFETFEDRAVTWTGSVDNVSPIRRQAAALGADQRWLYPALQTVAVEEGTTSVQVVSQTARALASAASMNRAIDAVTNKPETSSTITVETVALRQVATVQSGIPNYILESPAVTSIIESDLRLALAEALDAIAVAAVAGSPFTAPGDNVLISIRAAIGAMQADGYNPNVLILPPAVAEAIDVMRATSEADEAYFVFAPGSFAPSALFGLTRRVSKAAAAPIVLDTSAFGTLCASRVALDSFEENAGRTNTSLLRLETHAAVGVERANAARRIAAA